MPGTGNLTQTLPSCPRLTVQWGTHKGKDSSGLPPKHTLRQGMKTVHLEDGPGETTRGEGRKELGNGRYCRSSTWSPTPLETPGRKNSRSAPQKIVPAKRPQSWGHDPHWSMAAPGALTPPSHPRGWGGAAPIFLHPCRHKTIPER